MNTRHRPFVATWILANSWAEALGLGTTFAMGGWLASRFTGTGVTATLTAAALAIALGTLLEGVIVGLAQEHALAGSLVTSQPRAWTRATTVGAATAWIVGMVPSTVMNLLAVDAAAAPPEMPAALQYVLAALLGAVAGPILGLAQWTVLRRSVANASDWLLANGVAWAVGMPLIFLGMDFVPWDGPVWWRTAAIYIVCAGVGGVVGLLHGPTLHRLLQQPRPADAAPVGALMSRLPS